MCIACLPLIEDIGKYVSLNEGFCYINYRDHPLAVIWILHSLFFYVFVGACLVRGIRKLGDDGRIDRRSAGIWMVGYYLSLIGAFILGFPLSFFGLSGEEYPDKMNISSGVLAHGLQITNATIVGVWWCKVFFNKSHSGEENGKEISPLKV